jgi:hypothetical protein
MPGGAYYGPSGRRTDPRWALVLVVLCLAIGLYAMLGGPPGSSGVTKAETPDCRPDHFEHWEERNYKYEDPVKWFNADGDWIGVSEGEDGPINLTGRCD